MATPVILKKLSWTMEEGLLGKWIKHEGDQVKEGEALCEIETEKATDELHAPTTGTLIKIIYAEGSTIPVNSIIAVIGIPGEDISSMIGPSEPQKIAVLAPVQIKEQITVQKPRDSGEVRISPSARRLAREHGIDLTRIQGTGPGGRIVSEDVLRAVTKTDVATTQSKSTALIGHRKVIADRLSLSARTAVHVPITMEVDMTAATKLKNDLQEVGTKVSFTDIIVKIVAIALAEFPRANSMLLGEELRTMDDVNIGIAVGLEEDLLVPVIKNASSLSLVEISRSAKDLIERARNHTLTSKEMTGGTFTVSNLGMFGDVILFAPVINPPETAILGIGRANSKPIAIDGAIAVRPIVTLTLVFDHRVIDGMYATKFLQRVKELLQDPQKLSA
ncbi:MAG: dihydrolipoamide acetyltransferase family protein [Candidatus Bathyarchaeia archaeon]|jgi:pyruvate dehydrogenase E2 component (dihydrolipoamide acetyltransferase)